MGALYKGLIAATVISVILFAIANYYLLGMNMGIMIASLVGLGVMACLFMITEYYTGTGHRPVNEVAKASLTGAGTNIITGIAMGLEATALPVLVIVIGILWLISSRACMVSPSLRSPCSRSRASSWPSTPTVRSLTTLVASPRWPSCPRGQEAHRCAGCRW